ncbi:streptophobe family protein [Streptomyces sp. NPDC051452]|uniref:streptophobe family protein n=1 Tax=Streptomyces sp. NPDC051452 TaxID=3365654 RepID=UPI00379910CA
MSAATGVDTARHGTRLPWTDILLSAMAAVSWALIGMAAVAALGLHLLRADASGSLGPMTAAVVALAAGGSVTPSGDVTAFGLKGAEAHTALQITPLGVSLAGALLLSWVFLRSLRRAGVVVASAELLARAGTVTVLFVAMLGGLAWAGHDVITIDGGALGMDAVPGAGGKGGGGLSLPGLGEVGGLLPHRIGDLIDAKAAVGFTVDTPATLLGGLGWCAGVLVIALLAGRRAPLPPGWAVVHRAVRPAVSALVTVVLLTVAAGAAAAVYAAAGDDHPRRIAGAALLGAPNGTWLGLPLGLFVPWDGRATGVLVDVLPHPVDQLLGTPSDRPVTLGRMAGLDGRVWLLAVAAVVTMLLAGVLTAVRTPATRAADSVPRLAGRCALRLGVATALALPLLAWLTDVSVDASLSVLGIDTSAAGLTLHAHLGTALLLGAAWGAGAGATGAWAAGARGAVGARATGVARSSVTGVAGPPAAGVAGPVAWAGGAGAAGTTVPWTAGAAEGAGYGERAGAGGGGGRAYGDAPGAGGPGRAGVGGGPDGEGARDPGRNDAPGGAAGDRGVGPYASRASYRPPNPGTNPYLRVPEEVRDAPPRPDGDAVYDAPTIAGQLDPAPPPPPGRRTRRSRGRPPGPDGGSGWPPPPPPPPPPPVNPTRE